MLYSTLVCLYTSKIYDILEVLNDVNEDVCLMGEGLCSKGEHCVLHESWSKPKQLIEEMFKNSSLKDLQKRSIH